MLRKFAFVAALALSVSALLWLTNCVFGGRMNEARFWELTATLNATSWDDSQTD
jgi:hypothetical protein